MAVLAVAVLEPKDTPLAYFVVGGIFCCLLTASGGFITIACQLRQIETNQQRMNSELLEGRLVHTDITDKLEALGLDFKEAREKHWGLQTRIEGVCKDIQLMLDTRWPSKP
jgi:hypothetical protein